MWARRANDGASGPSPRVIRAARLLWLLFCVVLWNVIFDVHVQLAAIRYVAEQQHRMGYGARQSIARMMDPAIAAGFRNATVWSGLAAVGGLVAIAATARRRAGTHA